MENSFLKGFSKKLAEGKVLLKERKLLKKIKEGFKNNEFKMHLQFIVDNKTKKIVSAEALSRWENSLGETIFPGDYIGLMERSGLIVKFDYYMFEMVCKKLSEWTDSDFNELTISCNITRITISEKDFAEKMISLCESNFCASAQCGYEQGNQSIFTEYSEKPSQFTQDAESALLNQKLKSQSWAKIYKFFAFKQLFFPKSILNEDEFVTYRAIYNSKKVSFTNEKMYYYYQRDCSIMTEIAKKLRNNPHRFDWLKAYEERIEFFEKENKPQQVLRTHEKICTDIILRYSEQMCLKKSERDESCVNGEYLDIYRNSYKKMIKRTGISPSRRLMYIAFNIFPYSAVIMGKVRGLRK